MSRVYNLTPLPPFEEDPNKPVIFNEDYLLEQIETGKDIVKRDKEKPIIHKN